jgi:hypothetical protein
LLEVTVAMAILAISILALIRLLPLGLRNVQISEERSVASQLANDRFGRIQMVGPRQIELTGVSSETFNRTNAESVETSYSNFVPEGLATTVQPMSNSRENGLKRVTISVELPAGRTETYVTYVSKM